MPRSALKLPPQYHWRTIDIGLEYGVGLCVCVRIYVYVYVCVCVCVCVIEDIPFIARATTNLRLLREENRGLAARGSLRKDRLRYSGLAEEEEEEEEEVYTGGRQRGWRSKRRRRKRRKGREDTKNGREAAEKT